MIAISERAVKGLFVSDLDFHFTEYLTENAPKTTTHLSSPRRKRQYSNCTHLALALWYSSFPRKQEPGDLSRLSLGPRLRGDECAP